MPTKTEIRQREKEVDSATMDHTYTNPNCQCFLCKMDDTLVMGREGVGVNKQELTMSQQVSIGDRVIIQIKKSSKRKGWKFIWIRIFPSKCMNWSLKRSQGL